VAIRAASSPDVRTAEVLSGREHGRRDGDRAQVREKRPHRVLEHERVPGRARRGGEQHRLAAQEVLLKDLEEHLEQP
jgi:hypothetical protein